MPNIGSTLNQNRELLDFTQKPILYNVKRSPLGFTGLLLACITMVKY